MTTMEDRLRTTFRERVDDVTTEPALYRRVHERAGRLRRRRWMRLAPAGIAAVAIAVSVPVVLERGPDVPPIDDVVVEPAGANVPEELLVLRDGEVQRLEFGTDEVLAVEDLVAGRGASIATPGAPLPDGGLLAAVLSGDGTELARIDASGVERTEVEPSAGGHGGVAVSPDGRWTAVLVPSGSGSGFELRAMPNGAVEGGEPTDPVLLGPQPAGSRLQDWAMGAQPGTTAIVLRSPAGIEAIEVEEVASGGPATLRRSVNQTDLGGLIPRTALAVASSHLAPTHELGGVLYRLVPAGDGVRLQVADVGEVVGERDVTAIIGDAAPEDLWLDAWGDAVLLGDGQRSWAVVRDRDGDLSSPRALPEGVTRAAPVARTVRAPEVVAVPGDPEHALFVLADGTLVADDLGTGDRTTLHAPLHAGSGIHSLTVSVGATVEDFTAAAYDDGVGPTGVVTYVRRDGGDVVASFTAGEDLPGFASNRVSYAIAPDGRWLAYGGVVDDTRHAIHLLPIDPATGELLTDDVRILEGGDVRPSDWSGAVARPGDRSRLAGSTASGGLRELELERTEDGFTGLGASELMVEDRPEDVDARVAFTSQRPREVDDPRFELLRSTSGSADGDASDAVVLRYLSGDTVHAERKVPFGGVPVGNLSLAARGATALVVADAFGGSVEGGPGGRVLLVRAETSDGGEVDLPLSVVWSDGPVAGALLGGVAGDRPRP